MMTVEEIQAKVEEIIKGNPGITLNGIFHNHMKEVLNGKFPPVYNAVQELLRGGKIKKDAKKKNTGHYAIDAEIPADRAIGAPSAAPVAGVKNGGASHTAVDDNGQPLRPARKREPKGEFGLEKHENNVWRVVDESDFREPIENLMRQAVRLVPLDYRMVHYKTGEVLLEMSGKKSVPIVVEETTVDMSEDEANFAPTICIEA